jgi:hypothetical protein
MGLSKIRKQFFNFNWFRGHFVTKTSLLFLNQHKFSIFWKFLKLSYIFCANLKLHEAKLFSKICQNHWTLVSSHVHTNRLLVWDTLEGFCRHFDEYETMDEAQTRRLRLQKRTRHCLMTSTTLWWMKKHYSMTDEHHYIWDKPNSGPTS